MLYIKQSIRKKAGYINMAGFEGLKKNPLFMPILLLGFFHFLLILLTHVYHFQSLKGY